MPRISAFAAARSALLAALLLVLAACAHRERPATASADLEGEELQRQTAGRVEELLEGRFPGVRVLRHPSGALSIQIRGASSVYGSTEPLYVIDGLPLEQGSSGGLLNINPSDIERIEVLKDIGSTSFYGVRGANGVILITTRGAGRR